MLAVAAAARRLLRCQHMKIALVVQTGERVNVGDAAQLFRQLHIANGSGAYVGGRLSNGAVFHIEKLRRRMRDNQRAQSLAEGDQRHA